MAATHYDTLEISPQASPEVVRAAYRSLIQRFHPDRRPGDVESAQRASAITEAYEVLSDPTRRAAYDRDLAARTAVEVSAAAAGMADLYARRAPAPTPPAVRSSGRAVGWLWALLAIPVVWCAVWLATPKADAQAELVSIRHAFVAGGLPEARRRELYARKQDLLLQTPALRASAAAEAARDREARTVDLLDAPLVLRSQDAEITIPRLRVVLGSFDAGSLRAHIGRQNNALLSEIAQSVSRADAVRLAGPAGETYLKEVVLDALVRELGVHPGENYPSTYFESPGRYGVTEVLLPDRFSIRRA